MNLKDIENKLDGLFNKQDIRIIIWYDENKEFYEDINNLYLDNVEIETLSENNSFCIKYKIDIENPDKNYLLYAPFMKKSDTGNFLGDVNNYAYIFSPDKISLIMDELDISEDYRNLIENYSKFFNAKERINYFKRLHINYTENNIILGLLASSIKEKSINMDNIVRKVLSEGLNDSSNKYLDIFKKYDLFDDFWKMINTYYSYNMEPNLNTFFTSLIINYTDLQYSDKFPNTFKKYLVDNDSNIKVFLDNFMNNKNFSDLYDEFEENISKQINLGNHLQNLIVDDYISCNGFSLFDRMIVYYYVDLLCSIKRDINFDSVIEKRRKTHFYDKYENYYLFVKYANDFVSKINQFEEVSLPNDIGELINLYTSDFSYIDKFYRKFYYYHGKLSYDFRDKDKVKELRTYVENIYYNSFLNKINMKFYNLLSEIESLNNINITKQWNFYRDNIKHDIKKHKTVVIISDAFRYGCALELKKKFEMDPTRETTLKPMISTIPSYTSLGMACLLPHNQICYNKKDVLIDSMNTKSTQNRETILKTTESNDNKMHKAITYEELNKLERDELRNFFKNTQLVYIYHNQIDARGDNAETENEVFTAVEESFTEISDLITRLTNNINISHFYVTSDHGFIYKENKIEEYSKVELKNSITNTIYENRRFLLTEDETDIEGSLCLPMDYININDMYVTVPNGVNVFKVKGSGMNYVHGGASLEECIIPLMYVNTTTGKKNKQKRVELQLIDNKHKITNNINNFRFYQKENISDTVTELKASVYFVDDFGEKISDESIIYADINSDNPEDREFKIKLTLKDIKYDKSKDYYLIIEDITEKNNPIEVDRISYIIDIAFFDGFSF